MTLALHLRHAAGLRQRLGLGDSGFLFGGRQCTRALAGFDVLIHEVGHALSLDIPIFGTECALDDAINLALRSERSRSGYSVLSRRNECLVLASDVLVFRWTGHPVPRGDILDAMDNSDVTRRMFRQIYDTDAPAHLARRVVAWLRDYGVVSGTARYRKPGADPLRRT